MRVFVAAIGLVPLMACTIAQSDATAPGEPIGTCRSEPLAQFIGQAATTELGARMLKASGARIIRWVPQGGMVTMDFNPSRLTVQLDGANRVERANCG